MLFFKIKYPDSFANVIIITILAGSLSIAIHELGHYFAGKLVNFNLVSMSMIFVYYSYHKKVTLNHSLLLALFSYTDMIPSDEKLDYKNLLIFTLGGPVFSIISAIFSLMFSHIDFFAYYYILSLVIGVGTCLPFIEDSDGQKALELIKYKENSTFYKEFIDNYFYTINTEPFTLCHFKHHGERNYFRAIVLLKGVAERKISYNKAPIPVEYNNNFERNIISLLRVAIADDYDREYLTHIQDINFLYDESIIEMKNFILNPNQDTLDKARNSLNLIEDSTLINTMQLAIENLQDGVI